MFCRHQFVVLSCVSGLTALATFVMPCSALAQARRNATAPAEPPATESDPYLRELVRRSRQNNQQLALSIRDALRLNLIPLADQFLSSVAARNPSPQELAMMAEVISTERLLRVATNLEMGDAAKKQAQAMIDALRSQQQDTARLLQAANLLSSPSTDQQLGAMRVLLAGGEKSVEVLSLEIAKSTDNAKRDSMLQVLLKLGEGGKDALSQLAIYGTPELRAGAIQAITRVDESLAKPIAVAMLFDTAANEPSKAFVRQWLLVRYPKLPPQAEAELYLLDRLAQAKHSIEIASKHSGVTMLWAIGTDGKSLVHQRVTRELAAFRSFIDHARLLRQLPNLSPEAFNEGLSAELAYQYEIDPLGIEVDRAPILSIWGADALSAEHLDTLLQMALDRNDLAVAISTLHLMDESDRPDADLLMASSGSRMTALVAASMHAQPRVRFSAANAIARLEYQRAYTGCSDVLKRWLEMNQLTREPVILLVETRNEVSAQIERVLTSMGYRIEVVDTVQGAVQAVDRGGDLRCVVSTTILPDRSSLELVDRVRRRPLGKDLPILLHGPVDNGVNQALTDQRWQAPVVHFEIPASSAGWSTILQPIEATRPIMPLSAVERIDFKQTAARALGRIASAPDQFAFYDLHQLEQSVGMDAGFVPESSSMAFGSAQLAVLSVTPTRQAQLTLGTVAVRTGISDKERQVAVDALLFSMERHGNLLTSKDIQKIDQGYDSLLQSGQMPPDNPVESLLRSIYKRVGALNSSSSSASSTSKTAVQDAE